jgi:hypothetical protein
MSVIQIKNVTIEFTGEWYMFGDVEYKKHGGVFVMLSEEADELTASVIEVYGSDNESEKTKNIVTYHSMMITKKDMLEAKKKYGVKEWEDMNDEERAYQAAISSAISTAGNIVSAARVHTPHTKGADFFVDFYKQVAEGNYKSFVDPIYNSENKPVVMK